MIILYIILCILLGILIYRIYCFARLFFNFTRFYKHLLNLECDLNLYNRRKKILEEMNYSYDTIFSLDYSTNDVLVKSDLSQKELMAILYDDIQKLDNLIPRLPEYAFEAELKNFYELRRLIRAEKLMNENTTF